MKSEVLSAAARRNIFLSPDALEMVLSNSDPMSFINTVLTSLSEKSIFVDKSDIMDCIAGDKILFESPKSITPKNKRMSDLTIIPGTDVSGDSTTEGKINDFANYFKNRFYSLKKIIENRRDFAGGAAPISKAIKLNRDTKIIGMVYDKKDTKNGHVMLQLEDESGTCPVFISKDSPLISEMFITDEVIGVSGKSAQKGNMFIADGIYRPDVPSGHSWIPSDSVASVAFLSDVHVGSSTFMEAQWDRMIRWLKENAYDMDLDYIVFPGDVVDGIGVFPGQESELEIADIYVQYEKLAEYLKEIPDHIKMVIHPGNHDAVRLAEPQPALSEIFRNGFDSNIMMVGNPATMKIEGRNVTSYHGKSLDDWISTVQQLTYDDPVGIMKEMAIRRHLAPLYGKKTALAPERKDYMVMDHIPDIFVTGHVHGVGIGEYKGITMINASAWQDQTEYQRMHNFNPEPAVMPIVNLGSGKLTLQNFME